MKISKVTDYAALTAVELLNKATWLNGLEFLQACENKWPENNIENCRLLNKKNTRKRSEVIYTHANKKEGHPNSPALLKISIDMNISLLQNYLLYDCSLYKSIIWAFWLCLEDACVYIVSLPPLWNALPLFHQLAFRFL